MPPIDPSVELSKFGAELRRRREEAGLTLEALAKRSGLSLGNIGLVERGARDPSFSSVAALARGLGIKAGQFFGPKKEIIPTGSSFAETFDTVPPLVQASILALMRAAVRISFSPR